MTNLEQEPMIIRGRDLEPSRLVGNIVRLYDYWAQQEFLENRQAIKDWIDARFGELGMDTDRHHSVEPTLNAYNRDAGLGIQSLNLNIRRDDEPLRIRRAFKDSTLGVITHSLLDGPAIWDTVGFDVALGKIERLHQLSPNLRLASKKGDKVNEGRPKFLRGVVDVMGPRFATTVLQRKRTEEDGDKKSTYKNNGVYACDYLGAE